MTASHGEVCAGEAEVWFSRAAKCSCLVWGGSRKRSGKDPGHGQGLVALPNQQAAWEWVWFGLVREVLREEFLDNVKKRFTRKERPGHIAM